MINPYFLIITPIIFSLIFYVFKVKKQQLMFFIINLALLALAIINFIYIKNNETIVLFLGNYPQGVSIALKVDIISSVFIILTTFLFSIMYLFNVTRKYTDNLFIFLFSTLQSVIIGIFCVNDIFSIYVLIELSTIVVSILIMYKKDSRAIYDGMIYLLTNIVGMSFFLFGAGLIYKMFRTLDLDLIKNQISNIDNARALILPYSLLITGVGLKCALLPVFGWLPKAHGTPSAPSIVSAILSGLYVKSGIYLFIRLQAIFGDAVGSRELFLFIGFFTALIAVILAISQTDIKKILAYSTISQVGLIMIGINGINNYAYYGGIYHIINHSIFKSLLFLTAGVIIERYKERDINKIKGLFKSMPFVAIITIFAIFGIVGTPLFNGSISKTLLEAGYSGNIIEWGIILINIGTIVLFMKYAKMFFGSHDEKYEVDIFSKIAMMISGILCFLGGILGFDIINKIFGINIHVDSSKYTLYIVVFVISFLVAFVIYKLIIEKFSFFESGTNIELSFNGISISILSLFLIVFFYLLINL